MNSATETATGKPHELSRTLLPRHITMITIGGVIGAGLFVGSSAVIAAAGPAALLSYVIAGAIVFVVMRMLGEMALTHPHVRSFAEFSRLGLGNGAGFVAGWLYWWFWIVVVPIEAIAGAQILTLWFPLPVWQIGLVLMAVMTAVNLLSARSYGEFEFWFSSIKVAAIVAFGLVAAAHVFGLASPEEPLFNNLTAHGGFVAQGWAPVLAAVTTVFFSMVGPEITTVAAAESKDPERAVVRMATSISWRILVFYVASLFLIVSVVPWTRIVAGESPFTLALNTMGYGWGSAAMSFIILTAVLSCLNSAVYVCSRVLHVLADRGDAPRWLVEVNTRHVPARSIWLGSIVGVIGVVLAIVSPNAVFAFLVSSAGTVIVFVYLMTAVSQIRLRRRHPETETKAVRVWLFPWLSYAAIAGMVAVLVAMALTPALASQLWFSVLTLAVTVVAYLVVRRRR
ncbi:MAG TPA: amino acid permease [Steroidobacteraceae bacterium]|nr:amino acid permease [Steroidobacteraceae bacterium]